MVPIAFTTEASVQLCSSVSVSLKSFPTVYVAGKVTRYISYALISGVNNCVDRLPIPNFNVEVDTAVTYDWSKDFKKVWSVPPATV